MSAASTAAPLFLGLKLYEWLTLLGVIVGPVVAVSITLWAEHRRRQREARSTILKMLLNTRGLPSDASWSIAINMIPVEFNGHEGVIKAWREYIECVRFRASEENIPAHRALLNAKQTTLIHKIMTALGIQLSESDIQTESYIAEGYLWRDNLHLDSLAAMRDIATELQKQTLIISPPAKEEAGGAG